MQLAAPSGSSLLPVATAAVADDDVVVGVMDNANGDAVAGDAVTLINFGVAEVECTGAFVAGATEVTAGALGVGVPATAGGRICGVALQSQASGTGVIKVLMGLATVVVPTP
ncbi:MAG: hypothetical protein KDA41_08575 [Planctomycetales bacterium]|nr:hypothetical protein [Planctomycetales bacterium]